MTDDYKALVCVFLNGGNDQNATLIPYDPANHAAFASIRGAITHSRADLAPTALQSSQTLTNGVQYALNPRMPRMKALWDAGKAAALLNVGPLVQPLTRAQYEAMAPKPAKLFSHNDQQSTWQAYAPEGAFEGWGGLIGDKVMSQNANPLFTCISATGNAVFLSGKQAITYQISPNGAPAVKGIKAPLYGNAAGSEALRTLMTKPSANMFENEYNRVSKRAIEAESTINAALKPLATPFGSGSLDRQLKVVAQIIAARVTLGNKRQVFFVSLGGFDTHDNQARNHADLIAQLDAAIGSFYQATVDLGVADKVTTFTASDFGRTLQVNSDGTDHGWGSHHFIIGGAVKGGRYYGTAPQISLTSADQIGQGVLLPTTSVDQYAATLAKWFGVTDLPSIAPNIGKFAPADLGFMV
jgi:uncharacterized protein (DUF1501 family)